MTIARTRFKKNPVTVHLGDDDTARLQHHADRLNWDKTALIRTALFNHLNMLDEQEHFALMHKNARKKSGIAKIGELPGGREATGMNYKSLAERDAEAKAKAQENANQSASPVDDIPNVSQSVASSSPTGNLSPERIKTLKKDITDDFIRYFKYVQSAEGPVNRTMRLQQVHDALAERSPIQVAQELFVDFQERLSQREAAMAKPIMTIPKEVPVAGDVDFDEE